MFQGFGDVIQEVQFFIIPALGFFGCDGFNPSYSGRNCAFRYYFKQADLPGGRNMGPSAEFMENEGS